MERILKLLSAYYLEKKIEWKENYVMQKLEDLYTIPEHCTW